MIAQIRKYMEKAVLEEKTKQLEQLKVELSACAKENRQHYEAYLNGNGIIQYLKVKINAFTEELNKAKEELESKTKK